MTKFYVTDGLNKFLIDTNTHLNACQKALKIWEEQQKKIGKTICYSSLGFESSVSKHNCVETKIIKGLEYKVK
jgi:hypothetical protein